MTAAAEISCDALCTTTPSALTRPAAIAACARARLSNRPRATRRRSARSRGVMVIVGWALRPLCLTAWAKSFGAMPTRLRNGRRFCPPYGVVNASGQLHRFAADILAERFERLGDDAFGVETGLGVHGVRRILIDEDIRQHQRADLEAAV